MCMYVSTCLPRYRRTKRRCVLTKHAREETRCFYKGAPLASKFLNNESKIEKANERHPLGRIGNAKEIAQAAGFLLGPESSWMTGRVLQLDGGIGNLKT